MNFQRRTFVVKSQDRTSGTTTDFLYKLPMQLRDVVHVNLQHAIVENGVFNVTSENNKFVLNQLKNNPLTDASGSGGSGSGGDAYTDFSFQGNAVKIILDGYGNTQVFGLGRGGSALLTAEIPEYPSSILWSAIQPNNIPFSETGNISELKCIGYTNTTNGGLGTILVGGDLMKSGLPSQLLRSIDGGITFDYVPFGIGMPANSVNALGWADANGIPTWFMLGEDGTGGVKNKFAIDDTNDTILLTLDSNPVYALITQDVYSEAGLINAVNSAIATALAGTPTASGKITLTSNPYFNFEYTNPSLFSHILNAPDEKFVSNVTLPADGSSNAVITWNYRMTRGDSGVDQAYRWFIRRMDGTLVASSGFLTASGNPVPVDYIETNSITIGDFHYNGGEVLQLWFQPVFMGSSATNVGFKISLQELNTGTAYFVNTSTDASVIATSIAGTPIGNMLGVTSDFEFTTIGAPAQELLSPNTASTYPLWTSTDDGLTWNPLLVDKTDDSASSFDFGGFSMNINADNKIILGTDEGLLIADLDSYTTTWESIENDSTGVFLGTITAMDYAVGSPSATFVFGNSVGNIYQVKSTDTAEVGATFPTPTKLTSLIVNPNGNLGVTAQVRAIKYTGVLDNIYPTWIMSGSSLCFSKGTEKDITEINVVPFNDSVNLANFPELEPINGIEYDVATKTCIVVGTPIGSFTCSNYTSEPDLTDWITEKPYASNKLIQIPVGYYNSTLLATTIQTILNDSVVPEGGAFYVEVTGEGLLVITNTFVSNWAIRFTNGNVQYKGTAFLLGFLDLDKYYAPAEFDSGLTTASIQSDMDGGLNLTSYEYVCIQSDKFGNDMMTNKGTAFWWFVPNVSNGVNSTSIVYENTRNPTLEYLRIPRDIEQFDIRVIDQNGKIIQVADQKNVTIVIEFYLKTTCYPR